MDDRYWPARVGYLRRGTPVRMITGAQWGEDTVVTGLGVDEVGQYAHCADIVGCVGYDRLWLDLADVTARAHAAWFWTDTDRGLRVPVDALIVPCDSAEHRHGRVLCRMAAGDESVTVHEARAALAWVESAP